MMKIGRQPLKIILKILNQDKGTDVSKYVLGEIVLRHFSHLSTTITLACHIFLWRLKRQCHKRNQFSATTEIELKRENVIKEDVFNNQPRKMV